MTAKKIARITILTLGIGAGFLTLACLMIVVLTLLLIGLLLNLGFNWLFPKKGETK